MKNPTRQTIPLTAAFEPTERLVYSKGLTDSIEANGQLTPVSLLQTPTGYRILNGGSRIASLMVLNRYLPRQFDSVVAFVYENLTTQEIQDMGTGHLFIVK